MQTREAGYGRHDRNDNIQDQHCSCTAEQNVINLHLTTLIWRDTEM